MIAGWILLVYLADTVTAVSTHQTSAECEAVRAVLLQQRVESVCVRVEL